MQGPLPLSANTIEELKRAEQASETFEDVDEPCPGSRDKTGEGRYKNWVVRTYRYPNIAGCFEIVRDGKQVYAEVGFKLQIGGTASDEPKLLTRVGTDVTGNGIPDIVIGEWSGGAHCCFDLHIFELGKEAKRLARLELEDSGHAHFRDVDRDGRMELVAWDWTFAYWKTSFADSASPEIILQFQSGRFRLAKGLMRRPAPSRQRLERAGRHVGAQDGPDAYNGAFVTVLLDLIYTGHAGLAREFFDIGWQPKWKLDKQKYEKEFLEQLRTSPYWEDLLALNNGGIW